MPRHARVILIGGALGTLARAELTAALVHGPRGWPWATFLVNLLGAGLLGVVLARTEAGTRARGGLATGLCGGLTTFSTLQLELLILLDHGATGLAVGYAAASLAGGLALGFTGHTLGSRR